jgi:kinesin family protein 3/17
MMAMISPAGEGFGESISTLKFATRAKKIKNEARINEDVDQRALLRKYEVELRKLKLELNEKNRHINSHSHLLQLEEEKRRAEQDKAAAITALEERNREFFMERDEKKRLEEKIRALNSQMLIGGKKIEETPQFRSLLEEKQKLIR